MSVEKEKSKVHKLSLKGTVGLWKVNKGGGSLHRRFLQIGCGIREHVIKAPHEDGTKKMI
jgi:hypothetical protein